MSTLTSDSPIAARVFPSPNHGERANSVRPDCLVLHYTGMPEGAEALQRLCNPAAEVSSHYFVWEDGHVLQLVPESRRAWHAGKSFWKGETDLNSRSIGIEIVHPGHNDAGHMAPYPAAQIKSVIALCRDICDRRSIAPQRVLAHSDIAPGRKIDPGEAFPWGVLHAHGVGHWVHPARIGGGRFFTRGDEGQPIQALQAMLALYGYEIEITGVFDARTEAVVTAFQRHFRPQLVDGIADASTITTLRDLIATLPK
ncbi:N-acetylmuramoyl-L-alanine amidase [Methylovirgula sp. 4M-Z18]|uniref:N-acetylmuramoyl-L-alanine amidase n=1 Tax=Methylovirgula sp. 4M-Z18 TaxID=2293567 RepID=UPI000E2FBF9C|nr:N-acetylmuramoyl-L-alanine amidase [Methylovirgula sp. 4M-Z18]RFB79928.1 N-acetylmuramoyl-L-alanine amidase [Methylovirgula sp. 4M-Z18]